MPRGGPARLYCCWCQKKHPLLQKEQCIKLALEKTNGVYYRCESLDCETPEWSDSARFFDHLYDDRNIKCRKHHSLDELPSESWARNLHLFERQAIPIRSGFKVHSLNERLHDEKFRPYAMQKPSTTLSKDWKDRLENTASEAKASSSASREFGDIDVYLFSESPSHGAHIKSFDDLFHFFKSALRKTPSLLEKGRERLNKNVIKDFGRSSRLERTRYREAGPLLLDVSVGCSADCVKTPAATKYFERARKKIQKTSRRKFGSYFSSHRTNFRRRGKRESTFFNAGFKFHFETPSAHRTSNCTFPSAVGHRFRNILPLIYDLLRSFNGKLLFEKPNESGQYIEFTDGRSYAVAKEWLRKTFEGKAEASQVVLVPLIITMDAAVVQKKGQKMGTPCLLQLGCYPKVELQKTSSFRVITYYDEHLGDVSIEDAENNKGNLFKRFHMQTFLTALFEQIGALQRAALSVKGVPFRYQDALGSSKVVRWVPYLASLLGDTVRIDEYCLVKKDSCRLCSSCYSRDSFFEPASSRSLATIHREFEKGERERLPDFFTSQNLNMNWEVKPALIFARMEFPPLSDRLNVVSGVSLLHTIDLGLTKYLIEYFSRMCSIAAKDRRKKALEDWFAEGSMAHNLKTEYMSKINEGSEMFEFLCVLSALVIREAVLASRARLALEEGKTFEFDTALVFHKLQSVPGELIAYFMMYALRQTRLVFLLSQNGQTENTLKRIQEELGDCDFLNRKIRDLFKNRNGSFANGTQNALCVRSTEENGHTETNSKSDGEIGHKFLTQEGRAEADQLGTSPTQNTTLNSGEEKNESHVGELQGATANMHYASAHLLDNVRWFGGMQFSKRSAPEQNYRDASYETHANTNRQMFDGQVELNTSRTVENNIYGHKTKQRFRPGATAVETFKIFYRSELNADTQVENFLPNKHLAYFEWRGEDVSIKLRDVVLSFDWEVCKFCKTVTYNHETEMVPLASLNSFQTLTKTTSEAHPHFFAFDTTQNAVVLMVCGLCFSDDKQRDSHFIACFSVETLNVKGLVSHALEYKEIATVADSVCFISNLKEMRTADLRLVPCKNLCHLHSLWLLPGSTKEFLAVSFPKDRHSSNFHPVADTKPVVPEEMKVRFHGLTDVIKQVKRRSKKKRARESKASCLE